MQNKNQPKHKHNQTPHPNHSQPPHTPSTTTKTTSPATTITTNPKINLIAKKKKNSSWSLVVHYSLGFTAYKAANGGGFLLMWDSKGCGVKRLQLFLYLNYPFKRQSPYSFKKEKNLFSLTLKRVFFFFFFEKKLYLYLNYFLFLA